MIKVTMHECSLIPWHVFCFADSLPSNIFLLSSFPLQPCIGIQFRPISSSTLVAWSLGLLASHQGKCRSAMSLNRHPPLIASSRDMRESHCLPAHAHSHDARVPEQRDVFNDRHVSVAHFPRHRRCLNALLDHSFSSGAQ